MLSGTMRVELSLLSTASTTPSGTLIPTADDPSYIINYEYFDSLDSVLDLENTTLRREGVNPSIIVRSKLLCLYFELNMFDIFKLFLNLYITLKKI